jgi:hypothetical protein
MDNSPASFDTENGQGPRSNKCWVVWSLEIPDLGRWTLDGLSQ